MTQVVGPRMRARGPHTVPAPNTRSRCTRCGSFTHNVRTCAERLDPEALLRALIRKGEIKPDSSI